MADFTGFSRMSVNRRRRLASSGSSDEDEQQMTKKVKIEKSQLIRNEICSKELIDNEASGIAEESLQNAGECSEKYTDSDLIQNEITNAATVVSKLKSEVDAEASSVDAEKNGSVGQNGTVINVSESVSQKDSVGASPTAAAKERSTKTVNKNAASRHSETAPKLPSTDDKNNRLRRISTPRKVERTTKSQNRRNSSSSKSSSDSDSQTSSGDDELSSDSSASSQITRHRKSTNSSTDNSSVSSDDNQPLRVKHEKLLKSTDIKVTSKQIPSKSVTKKKAPPRKVENNSKRPSVVSASSTKSSSMNFKVTRIKRRNVSSDDDDLSGDAANAKTCFSLKEQKFERETVKFDSSSSRDDRMKLIAEVLSRWWFCLPSWPPDDIDYDQILREAKLRHVSLEDWESAEEVNQEGSRKVYEVSYYPGVFRDSCGQAHDLRPKKGKPCFSEMSKYSDVELNNLLIIAYENQLADLEKSPFASTEKKYLERLRNSCRSSLNDIRSKMSKLKRDRQGVSRR